MRIAQVVGSVTLNLNHASFERASLKVVMPLEPSVEHQNLVSDGEIIVAWDELGCGVGAMVAISEGTEAARPFRPDKKPIDAYVAALLDTIELDWQQIKIMNDHKILE